MKVCIMTFVEPKTKFKCLNISGLLFLLNMVRFAVR